MASGHVNRENSRTHARTDQCCMREESACQLGAGHTRVKSGSGWTAHKPT